MKIKETKHGNILTAISKKEIIDHTKCIRGSGFNPAWKYIFHIPGVITLEKGFIDPVVMDENGHGVGSRIYTKKDFVNTVYDHIN